MGKMEVKDRRSRTKNGVANITRRSEKKHPYVLLSCCRNILAVELGLPHFVRMINCLPFGFIVLPKNPISRLNIGFPIGKRVKNGGFRKCQNFHISSFFPET